MDSMSCPSQVLQGLYARTHGRLQMWEDHLCRRLTSSKSGTTCSPGRMRHTSWTGRRRRKQCSERKGMCTCLICSWRCHQTQPRQSSSRPWRLMQLIMLRTKDSKGSDLRSTTIQLSDGRRSERWRQIQASWNRKTAKIIWWALWETIRMRQCDGCEKWWEWRWVERRDGRRGHGEWRTERLTLTTGVRTWAGQSTAS